MENDTGQITEVQAVIDELDQAEAVETQEDIQRKAVLQEYEQLYRAEMQAGLILSVFSTIAIFIACLGLFGLVSYVAIKKSKEISIRKVLGAESFDILRMLSSEFVKLLGISALLAVVIGSFTFNSWLESFAYRTDLPFWIYVVAVVLVVAISLITILYKSLIAATRNPINNLKSE